MKRVTGLGGVFFKVKDVKESRAWYLRHLGIDSDDYGGKFTWRNEEYPEKIGITAWSPFPHDTAYFKPADKPFMLNYRVENLEELLKVLKEEGIEIVGGMEEYEYGKFAWIMDPDGYKIELWEPPDTLPEGF